MFQSLTILLCILNARFLVAEIMSIEDEGILRDRMNMDIDDYAKRVLDFYKETARIPDIMELVESASDDVIEEPETVDVFGNSTLEEEFRSYAVETFGDAKTSFLEKIMYSVRNSLKDDICRAYTTAVHDIWTMNVEKKKCLLTMKAFHCDKKKTKAYKQQSSEDDDDVYHFGGHKGSSSDSSESSESDSSSSSGGYHYPAYTTPKPSSFNTISTGTYYFNNCKKLDWHRARCYCAKMGMKLLEINSEAEYTAVRNMLAARGVMENETVWLGLTDCKSEGNFTYPADLTDCPTSPQFTAWDVDNGEPDNTGLYDAPVDSDCVVFIFKAPPADSLWEDVGCRETKAKFVCELTNFCYEMWSH